MQHNRKNLAKELLSNLGNPANIGGTFWGNTTRLHSQLARAKVPEGVGRQFFHDILEEDDCVCGNPWDDGMKAHIHSRIDRYLADDIMTVVAWSMRHLVAGSRPCCRHDGTAWAKSDAKRLKKNGLPLPLRACLVQVRADWDWMGKCFHFPFHNVKEGCCWLCKCKRHQARFL